MTPEVDVASRIWPEHAEMLSDDDWIVLQKAIDSDQPIDERIVVPLGESKDLMLQTLVILFWTMKIVHLGLEISKEVGDLKGKERIRAIVEAVTKRLPSGGPKVVYDRIMEIVSAIKI